MNRSEIIDNFFEKKSEACGYVYVRGEEEFAANDFVTSRHLEVVKYLIEKGANMYASLDRDEIDLLSADDQKKIDPSTIEDQNGEESEISHEMEKDLSESESRMDLSETELKMDLLVRKEKEEKEEKDSYLISQVPVMIGNYKKINEAIESLRKEIDNINRKIEEYEERTMIFGASFIVGILFLCFWKHS